jgi:DNA-binding NtrC family response regulator
MPRLVIGRGTSEERVCTLSKDVIRIGRSPDSDLILGDPTVSRSHAEVIRRDGVRILRDLQSTGGTRVADRGRIREAPLRHGDRIRIGQTELIFEEDEVAAGATLAGLPGATIAGMLGDARSAPASGPHVQRSALDEGSIAFRIPVSEEGSSQKLSGRRAEMLSKVAGALQWVTDLDEVLDTLLDVVFELFRPDRGVILLIDPDTGRLTPRVARPSGDGLVISQTIVEYTLAQRMSVLIPQTSGDERFKGAESVVAQSIQAAICCPLICRGRDLGTLYVDTQVNLLRYGREDLALFNLVAANAALAIDNALLLRSAREAARLGRDEPGRVIAESATMQELLTRLARARRKPEPLLLTGEPGAGKFFAAKLVHCEREDPEAPFIAVDCADLAGGEFPRILLGSEARAEVDVLARTGGLARSDRRGLFELARGGSLVLRRIEALDQASQEILAGVLSPAGGTGPADARVHLIATTRETPESLAAGGRLHPALALLLLANPLALPPLRDRVEDIVPLAVYFLSKSESRGGATERFLNASAETALRRLRYRHGNVAELREAIELAAVVSDTPEIGAEHLFTGPKCRERRAEQDLAGSPLVRLLVQRRTSGVIQAVMLTVFAGITAACLAAANDLPGRIANGLVWGLWWPGLFVLFLLVGRVWCPVCPISSAGRSAKLLFRHGRKPPPWMKKHTGAAMTVLFLVIIWAEQVFHMPATPAATGVFLLTLVACSVVLCAIYEREVWCRYLCPLGALSAGYAIPSPVLVHANPVVCASKCQTHDCSKGSDRELPCPVFLHPLYVRDAHFCKLCLTCLRSCRHGSARLYARPPLLDLWRRAELSATLTPFATVTFFTALVMLAAQKNAWGMHGAVGFTAATLAAVGAGIALSRLLPRLLGDGDDQATVPRIAFSLMIAAWGSLMAFHLEHLPALGTLGIHAQGESALGRLFPTFDLSLLGLFQISVIVLSALPALVSIGQVRRQVAANGAPGSAWGWRTVHLICAAHPCVAAALVLGVGKAA